MFVEGVSHKIRRQIEDLERAGGVDSGALTVDGVPVDTYLTRSGLPLPVWWFVTRNMCVAQRLACLFGSRVPTCMQVRVG